MTNRFDKHSVARSRSSALPTIDEGEYHTAPCASGSAPQETNPGNSDHP